MNLDSKTRVAAIAELNDQLRTKFVGGKVCLTAGVASLSDTEKKAVLQAVRTFEAFDEDNDPHGERDMVFVEVGGVPYIAAISYYAPDMQSHSEDPSDPTKTRRVLLVMQADEY